MKSVLDKVRDLVIAGLDGTMANDRNLTVYTYNEPLAIEIYERLGVISNFELLSLRNVNNPVP